MWKILNYLPKNYGICGNFDFFLFQLQENFVQIFEIFGTEICVILNDFLNN